MSQNEKALTVQENSFAVMPVMNIQQAIERYEQFKQFVGHIMVEGVDYGVIPGTTQKTLLLPGAEKLSTFFGLLPRFEIIEKIEDWTGKDHGGEPFFHYLYRCSLYRNGQLIAESDGSCNSWEAKYRYRKQERVCPNCGAENIRKSKQGGGWYCWAKTGGCGATFPDGDDSIEGQEVGRKPNPDISDQVNTFQKIAQKRAFVGTVKIGTNASDYFTQDMEDFTNVPIKDAVIEGEFTEQPPKPKSSSTPKKDKQFKFPSTAAKKFYDDCQKQTGNHWENEFHFLKTMENLGLNWSMLNDDEAKGKAFERLTAVAKEDEPSLDDVFDGDKEIPF